MAHAGQDVAAGVDVVGCEPLAFVPYVHADVAVHAGQADLDLIGFGVLSDVRQGLLHQLVHGELSRAIELNRLQVCGDRQS